MKPQRASGPVPRRRSSPKGTLGRIPASQESALTAAASQILESSTEAAQRLVQPWQWTALQFYNTLEVCHDPAQYYARSLSQVRLFVQEENEQGESVELKGGEDANEPLDRMQDPGGGGREQLLGSYGRLQFLNGDGYLTCLGAETEEEEWRYLSVLELRPGANGWIWQPAPQVASMTLRVTSGGQLPEGGTESAAKQGPQAAVWRLWNPHPAYSRLADCPVLGVLPLYALLQASDRALEAITKSRAANAGILVYNQDIDFANADQTNADEDPEAGLFMRFLTQAFSFAINNPGSAAAVAPITVGVDGDMIGKTFEKIELRPAMDSYAEKDLQEWLINRIAVGLDMEPEQLKGLSEMNHWGAKQVDETGYRLHIKPVLERFCNDVTAAYLRPAWRQMGLANWQSLSLAYDAADLVVHPDRAKDVRQAHEDGVASSASYLDSIGLSESDRMPEEEHQEWLAIKLRDKSLVEGEEDVGVGPSPSETIADEEDATSVTEPVPELPMQASGNGHLVAAIVGAAEVAAERAREVAGAKLRTRVRNDGSCADCIESIQHVENSLVASTLGREQVTGLDKRSANDLVGSSADGFVRVAIRLGATEQAARKLGDLVEQHAARELFNETPAALPAGFQGYAQKVLR